MNDAMRRLEGLVGEWDLTMTHAWFLDSMDTEVRGSATFEWVGDAFVLMRSGFEDGSSMQLVFGRSDARDEYAAFSHDDRGVYRVFTGTVEGDEWTLLREDPDFHQRIVMRVQPDQVVMRADASEDEGRTWRKDLDFIFERRTG